MANWDVGAGGSPPKKGSDAPPEFELRCRRSSGRAHGLLQGHSERRPGARGAQRRQADPPGLHHGRPVPPRLPRAFPVAAPRRTRPVGSQRRLLHRRPPGLRRHRDGTGSREYHVGTVPSEHRDHQEPRGRRRPEVAPDRIQGWRRLAVSIPRHHGHRLAHYGRSEDPGALGFRQRSRGDSPDRPLEAAGLLVCQQRDLHHQHLVCRYPADLAHPLQRPRPGAQPRGQ